MNPAIAHSSHQSPAQRHECAASAPCSQVNVGQTERAASLVAGGLLFAYGLSRGGLTLAALGAALAYRGYTGHCHLYEATGQNTAA